MNILYAILTSDEFKHYLEKAISGVNREEEIALSAPLFDICHLSIDQRIKAIFEKFKQIACSFSEGTK